MDRLAVVAGFPRENKGINENPLFVKLILPVKNKVLELSLSCAFTDKTVVIKIKRVFLIDVNDFIYKNKLQVKRIYFLDKTNVFCLRKDLILLKKNCVEWYVKNRWWIWTITGIYLAYRILTGLYY